MARLPRGYDLGVLRAYLFEPAVRPMMKQMRIRPEDIAPGAYLCVVAPTSYCPIPLGAWVRVDTLPTQIGYATVTYNKQQYRLDVSWSCRLPSDLERLAAAATE